MLIKNHQSYISNKVFSGILVAVYLFSMAFPQAVYAMPEQRVNAQTAEIGSHVKPITVQAATWPIYFDLVLDETRGWIYGSDSAGNKIDVISASTLMLVKSFVLVNGSNPKGLDLNPDGSELAIAQNGASSILFLNPDTGATIASVIPNTGSLIKPWDVIYGREGRLYSSGNPAASGTDYIHIIDTVAHIEIARSSYAMRMAPTLAISSDKNSLYANNANSSPEKIFKINVTDDTLPTPISTVHLSGFTATKYVLDTETDLIFTDTGQVWTTDLKAKVGSTGLFGPLALIPGRGALAVASSNTIIFVSTTDFYTLSTYALPAPVTIGPLVAQADGNKLYASTSSGIVAVDLSAFPPGEPGIYPTGSLPYFDLVLDEARGVLYGSNTNGHHIDVMSVSTLQVIDQIRLNNGSRPLGMDLNSSTNELAVALGGASQLVFIDTNTNEIITALIPIVADQNLPFDVKYGRAGRLYSTGSGQGNDYVHVIDTTTYTEIGRSQPPNAVTRDSYLAVTEDKNFVFAREDSGSRIYKFNVSTDIPVLHASASSFIAETYLLLKDNTKIFTSAGKVWSSDLAAQIGSFGLEGNLVEIPDMDLVAVISSSTPGLVSFVKTADYYITSTASVPSVTAMGAGAVTSDGGRLFLNTNNGVKALNISENDPTSVSVESGSVQTVQVTTPFLNPLEVKVQNLLGNPMAGVTVTFQAPASGPSGIFADTNSNTTSVITDANGIAASPILTANNVAGNFAVQASVPNLVASAAFQLTSIASVSCTTLNGSGSATLFQPYKQYRCGKVADGVASGDFNADGRKDVALTTTDGLLLIYLQDVDGDLSLQPRVYLGGASRVLGVGDLNHDGRDDIVIPSGNTIRVFLQKSDGLFLYPLTYSASPGAGALAVGDVNEDGLSDVVVSLASNLLGVFSQRPDGTLNSIVTYPSLVSAEIAIGDINGDGLNDVVSMNTQGSNQLQIFTQSSNKTLNPYFSRDLINCTFCAGGGIGIGDINDDARPDIMVSYGGNRPSSNIAVFAQDANGNLLAPTHYPSYDSPQPVEVADLDSDNLSDIVTLHGGWLNAGVYLQQGNGTLSAESLYSIPNRTRYYPLGLDIDDVNADGFPDLLIADGQGLVVQYRNPNINATPTPTATPPYSYNPLYLSLTGNQTIGGVTSADEDILKFDGTNWSLLFDGSDVGVGSSDLFGFSFIDSDSILMSFSANVTVNGIAANPQDILRFDAASLGSTTSGTWSMYFDGSDVGFDTTAEKIDSVSLLPDGRILLSTTGNPAVVGVTGAKDEDVLAFTPTTLGNTTSGSWSMYFDGSDVGLGETSGEDVDALDVTANGNIYLSTADNFVVNGVSGADEDVFVCVPTSVGDVTGCNYSTSLYFDGSTWGLSANDVDAINLFTTSSIPTATPTVSATPSQTQTPGGPTITPTRTVTPSQTPLVSFTPPTATFTSTPTPTRTNTPTTTSQVLPDLTITAMRIELQNPSCQTPGDPMGVRVWVQNIGQSAVGSFVVNVNGAEQTINGLGIGETKSIFFAGAGNPVTAVVDSTGVVAESNENNNTRSETLPIPTPPAPCATNTPTSVATFTPTFTNTPSQSDLIFTDGLESGNLSAWTANTNDSGDLSANPSAALIGTYGLQAVIDDTNTIYVTDDAPNAEPRYRARFYFDPNSLTMASNDAHFIFKGFAGTATDVFQIELRNASGLYQIRAKVLNDGSAFVVTNWFTISDASHFIEVDWRAASGIGANNGGLTLWIDGLQQANLTGIDNDSWRVDRARLGALAGMDVGTSGTYYFDAFESRRQSYIGP